MGASSVVFQENSKSVERRARTIEPAVGLTVTKRVRRQIRSRRPKKASAGRPAGGKCLFHREQHQCRRRSNFPLLFETADAFAMPTDLFSLGDLGGILIGFVVVAALIFSITVGVDDPSGLPGLLRRSQVKKDGSRSSDPRGSDRVLAPQRMGDAPAGASKSVRKEEV
jgi:hypothetical protein